MTSNDHTQSPPHSHSQPLTPKQEPQIDDIATPPHNESSSFYISHKYQPPNFDFTRNRFAKSLKYQSPHSGCADKGCCSPSFFLDFANVKPILSPLSSDTVPSQVGSTYTEKHLAFARTHDTPRPPISSFDTNLTGIDTSNDHKMSSPEENSVIVCKFETVEEEEEENKQEEREERKREKEVRDHPMKTRGRKRKDMEEEKLKKAVIMEKKNEKLKESRRTRRKMKETKEMRNDEETGGYKPEEAVQVLDAFIENLNKKLSQPEMVKQEAMVEEKPADYGIEISSNNFCFESDSEEIKELLTEEESINVLKKMCKQRKPSVQFLSRLSDYREISDTVLIDETGLRQNGGKGLRFFKADERTSGRILSLPEHLDDLPTNLSKKISKLTKEESYQCRYCGKQFQKGCALGGHISRIHKGESVNFKMRQETRKKRVADRTRGKFLRKESVKQLESKETL